MRRIWLVVAICTVVGVSGFAFAAPPIEEVPPPPQRAPALRAPVPLSRLSPEARAIEIARLRYQLYRRAYPLRLNQYDAEIELAIAELHALDRQIDEYESISRPYMSHPFLVTLESARMRRLATELRLKTLREEKLLAIHNYSIERRLLKAEIEAGY